MFEEISRSYAFNRRLKNGMSRIFKENKIGNAQYICAFLKAFFASILSVCSDSHHLAVGAAQYLAEYSAPSTLLVKFICWRSALLKPEFSSCMFLSYMRIDLKDK